MRSRKIAAGFRRSRPRVHVLAYHAIADLSGDPVLAEYGVSPDLFARHLDRLRRGGWSFVDLTTARDAIAGKAPPPGRAVLITFDDAYVDLLEAALPLLSERGIPAVVFAISGRVGGTNAWDGEKGAAVLDLLGPAGLREVAAGGIEVGSHTASHRPLPEVPAAELGDELEGSAGALEALGLPRPRSFSYPYGRSSETLQAAVREAGFELAFTTAWGVAGPGSDRFALPRIEVHASDTPAKLLLKLAAAGWPGRARDLFLWLMRVRLDPSSGPRPPR